LNSSTKTDLLQPRVEWEKKRKLWGRQHHCAGRKKR